MKNTLALFRFINILIVTSIWAILSLSILQIIPRRYIPYASKMWAYMTLSAAGVRLHKKGEFNPFIEPNRMVVSNHISWMDVPVLQTVYSSSFIGKAEMRKWPVLGTMIKTGGTIFIDRTNKRQLIHINQQVKDKLLNGQSIGLFPEGKTGPGDRVLEFKAPILEAAILAGSKIVPLVLEYCDSQHNRTRKVTYAGRISLYKSIRNTLSLKRIHVKIYALPEVNAADFAKREELSAYLYDQISKRYTKTTEIVPSLTA